MDTFELNHTAGKAHRKKSTGISWATCLIFMYFLHLKLRVKRTHEKEEMAAKKEERTVAQIRNVSGVLTW